MERRMFLLGVAAIGLSGPAYGARGRVPADFRSLDLMAGGFALKSSQLTLNKSTSPDIARFANAEIAEQVQVSEMLGAAPGTAPLRPDHAVMLGRLSSMPAGRLFERTYVQGQLVGHRELLALNQAYLQSGQD